MKKITHLILSAVIGCVTLTGYSQGVGINESEESPDPSAMLDIKSQNKGLLIPRMSQEQRTQIVSPASGLMVYQTDEEPGYYYFTGTAWERIGLASESVQVWQVSGADVYYQAGNVGIGTDAPETPLEVTGLMRLTPSGIPAACDPDIEGSIYYDTFLNELCYCNGLHWMQLDGGGICQCPDQDGDGNDACDPGNPYDWDGLPADCDDNDPARYYGAMEICDNKDNDCNGQIDEPPAGQTWYFDNDFDGWGVNTLTMHGCDPEEGYVEYEGDCDDNDAEINPGAWEMCDNIDNDCDGTTDEDDALDADNYYLDSDADGYGDPEETITSCWPVFGWVLDDTDCDDNDASVYPGATEICGDLIDNDCDGLTDSEDPDCE